MPHDVAEWRKALEEERAQKDAFMVHHPESPFVAERVLFRPLRYFDPDPRYRLEARLERRPNPEEAYLRTNRDGESVMRYVGDLSFTFEGRALRLRVYHAGEGVGTSVFVPFRDGTSGRESYGPGRYLTLEMNEEDRYQLDFNLAFNPYCAYTEAYECGFPPAENDLPVEIRAGEKVWAEEENPRSPSDAILTRTKKLLARRAPTAKGKAPRARRPGARPPTARRATGGTARRRR